MTILNILSVFLKQCWSGYISVRMNHIWGGDLVLFKEEDMQSCTLSRWQATEKEVEPRAKFIINYTEKEVVLGQNLS